MLGTLLAIGAGGFSTLTNYQAQRVALSTAKRDAKIAAAQQPDINRALIYGLLAGAAAAALFKFIGSES